MAAQERAFAACNHPSSKVEYSGQLNGISTALNTQSQLEVLVLNAANERIPKEIADLARASGHKTIVVATHPGGSSLKAANDAAHVFNQHYINFANQYPIEGYHGGIAYKPAKPANDINLPGQEISANDNYSFKP